MINNDKLYYINNNTHTTLLSTSLCIIHAIFVDFKLLSGTVS